MDTKIPKILFPIIRRSFPTMIASELIKVQPISAPTSSIFYIKNRFTKYFRLNYYNYKIASLAVIFYNYVPQELKEVKLENNEVKYYA